MLGGVVDDLVPLIGCRAGHNGHHWFGIAQVKDFVGHTGFNKDKVAGFVFHSMLQIGAILVTHAALQQKKQYAVSRKNINSRSTV